jgi:aminopeptidase N
MHILGGFFNLQAQISDSIDVVHYRISIDSLNFNQKYLEARAEVTLTPALGNSLSGICLELLGLDADSVKSSIGVLLPHTHSDTLVRFGLPASLNSGDTATYTIYYSGNPHVEPYNWGGFHFQGTAYAYNLAVAIADIPHNYGKVMFPCVDDFRDRASYEFIVRAPAGKEVASVGLLQSVTPHPDGYSSWHWKLEEPIPTYLACIAVSDYALITDTFNSVNGPVPVTIHVPPADSLKAVQSFVNLVPICELFEQRFGPYAWPRVGYAVAPKGAMEHATCITYPRNSVDGTLAYEYLYAHELAHMWFGDLVTCDGPEEMWLNEGWASFAEFIYKEGLYGVQARKDYVRKSLKGILQTAHMEEGGYRALYGMPQQYTYGSTIYEKGACVAHTLRGHLGDSIFFPAVRHFLDQHAFGTATSASLRDALEQYSGQDLDDFFDTWVYSPGYPHFRIDSFRILPLSMPPPATVEVSISQQGKGTIGSAASFRIQVMFMNEQWQRHTVTIDIDSSSGSAVVEVPFWPTRAFIDPEEMVCDATTDAFLKITSTGRKIFPETYCEADIIAVSDSALLRATHHWVAPEPNPNSPAGFRLSDYRYWTVNGIGTGDIQGKLRFLFTKFSYLDQGIILHPADSVVLMYRPGPGHLWAAIAANLEGQTYQGYLVTDSIVAGDYAIGVWDHTYLPTRDRSVIDGQIRVWPNPSQDTFTIQCQHPDASGYRIFTSDGQELIRGRLDRSQEARWSSTDQPAGIYHIILEDRTGRSLGAAKAIKQ